MTCRCGAEFCWHCEQPYDECVCRHTLTDHEILAAEGMLGPDLTRSLRAMIAGQTDLLGIEDVDDPFAHEGDADSDLEGISAEFDAAQRAGEIVAERAARHRDLEVQPLRGSQVRLNELEWRAARAVQRAPPRDIPRPIPAWLLEVASMRSGREAPQLEEEVGEGPQRLQLSVQEHQRSEGEGEDQLIYRQRQRELEEFQAELHAEIQAIEAQELREMNERQESLLRRARRYRQNQENLQQSQRQPTGALDSIHEELEGEETDTSSISSSDDEDVDLYGDDS